MKVTTKNGTQFIIDEESIPFLSVHHWYFEGRYIKAQVRGEDNIVRPVYFHRLIMNAPKGMFVDHINGDILDNRRANLRVCTKQQNTYNQVKRGKSPYKGVYRRYNRWTARLGHEGKMYVLGNYSTPEEAALAYNAAAIKYFGEFAKLNQTTAKE